ncbi:MAG: hypothetical protein RR224_12520 [Clostridia bacterium]
MKKYLRSFYGVTGSINVKRDGSAVLTMRDQYGKLVGKSTHKNERCAMAKWNRFGE